MVTRHSDGGLKRWFRFLFGIEPMKLEVWEQVVMRFGIAMVTWMTLKYLPLPFSAQPVPHGFASWGINFTWLANADITTPLWWGCIISLALYVVGVWPVLTLLTPLMTVVAQGILSNSQGAIHHTSQIIGVALFAAWIASAFTLQASFRKRSLPHGFTAGQLELDWVRQMLMAGYVVSALMKLMDSGGDWLGNTPYFGLQIEKSTGMAFHSHLQHPGNAAWLAQYFIDHPLLAKITIGMGLPLELFAFLALHNRRMALIFGVSLYLFHTIITEVMHLGFAYNRWLLLFLFINPLWWLKQVVVRLISGKDSHRQDSQKQPTGVLE